MSTNSPFFSVVMSSHNNVLTIDEAILGVLRQNFVNFELILISDGSDDGTEEKMRDYALKSSRIQFVDLADNVGQSFAKNVGILRARGRYIAIADADDIWLYDKLMTQYQYLIKNPEIDVLGGQMIRFGSWGRAIHPTENPLGCSAISKKLHRKRNPMNNPTVVFRKEAFLTVGGYRSDFKRNADWDLFMRMNKRSFKFANLPSTLVMYRTSSPVQPFKYWVKVEFHRQEILLANSHIFVRFFPIIRYPNVFLSFIRMTIVYLMMRRESHNVV